MSEQQKNGQAVYSPWFLLIVAIFITCLITANIMAVKIVEIAGLFLPAAIIIFPISYIFGDVLTEVYGYKTARRVIWLGFLCNLFAVIAFQIGMQLPSAPFWGGQDAYKLIFGSTPQILGASFAAYLVGEFANSLVLAKLKIATQGRWLWLRTISSTLIGEGLDSVVFITLSGIFAPDQMPSAIVTQWLVKTGYEIVATPLTYGIVDFLKRKEGIDVYDHQTRFNPLLISE
jgi:uncharacterized integral membrane protein (TIGR00697 family)